MKPYEDQFKHGWQPKGPLLCGMGSLEKYAKPSRQELAKCLKSTGAKSVLELGCGDLVWHGENLPHHNYTGIDLHERDTWNKRREEGAILIEMEAGSPNLPHAEFIVARDVFIHLSNRYIVQVLEYIKEFGTWLLASYDPFNNDRNRDGEDFFKKQAGMDLSQEPFNLKFDPKSLHSPKSKGMALFNLKESRR